MHVLLRSLHYVINWAKKGVLFLEIGRVKIFFIIYPLACVSEYIFLIKKKQKKLKKKRDLTGYDNINCEFALNTFNLLDRVVNFAWLFI